MLPGPHRGGVTPQIPRSSIHCPSGVHSEVGQGGATITSRAPPAALRCSPPGGGVDGDQEPSSRRCQDWETVEYRHGVPLVSTHCDDILASFPYPFSKLGAAPDCSSDRPEIVC